MNSRRGMVDRVGRWDAVATIELLEGPAFAASPASPAPPLFPKRRQFCWWQVTAECQMKRAHAGKRVNIEALAKIVIDGHHCTIHSRCDIDLSRDDGVIFHASLEVAQTPGPRHDDRCIDGR